MNLSNESFDNYIKSAKSSSEYLSRYPWAGFSKSDKIIVSVSTHRTYANSDPIGSVALGAFTDWPNGKELVQMSFRSITYVVPANTSDAVFIKTDSVGTTRDDPVGHFSVKCTNASKAR